MITFILHIYFFNKIIIVYLLITNVTKRIFSAVNISISAASFFSEYIMIWWSKSHHFFWFSHIIDMVRLKNRWLLFEIVFEDTLHCSTTSQKVEPLSTRDVYSAIKESIQTNFGDYGVGCVGISLNGNPFVRFPHQTLARFLKYKHYFLL